LGRRERKREGTRQDILLAATHLFKEKGFEAASIDEIVGCADLAKGTFYYHFQSKDEVLGALRFQAIEAAVRAAETLLEGGQSPLEVIQSFLVNTATWSQENPELARAFYTRGPQFLPRRLAKDGKVAAVRTILSRIVAAGQAQGQLRSDLDADTISQLIIFLLFHAQATWVFEGEKDSVVQRVTHWYRAVLEGIAVK